MKKKYNIFQKILQFIVGATFVVWVVYLLFFGIKKLAELF